MPKLPRAERRKQLRFFRHELFKLDHTKPFVDTSIEDKEGIEKQQRDVRYWVTMRMTIKNKLSELMDPNFDHLPFEERLKLHDQSTSKDDKPK